MNTYIFLKFVAQLALPPASLMAGLIVGGLLVFFRLRRLGKVVCGLAIVHTLVLSFLPVSDLLMEPLQREARAEAAAAPPCCYDAIIVMGGAIAPAEPPLLPDPDLSDASDRIWHAARLYHRGVAPRIIVSGGSYAAQTGVKVATEADAMRRFLLDLGVPSEAIVEEGRSLNTIENVTFVRELVHDKPVALVTSAYHMPRALRLARRLGLKAEAFPTDWRLPSDTRAPWENWLPSISAMAGSGLALWEFAAYLFDYRTEGVLR
ncbi:MAG: YdcF family protein [Reyranellales bacterium]